MGGAVHISGSHETAIGHWLYNASALDMELDIQNEVSIRMSGCTHGVIVGKASFSSLLGHHFSRFRDQLPIISTSVRFQ
jgi:hypothetical protein